MMRPLRALLYKIPAIARQMSRITDIEVALQAQAVVVADLERRMQQLAQKSDLDRAVDAAGLEVRDTNDLVQRMHSEQTGQYQDLSDSFSARIAHLEDALAARIIESQPAPVEPVAEVKAEAPQPEAKQDPRPVAPYTFQQLLDRDVEHHGLDLVLQVHVPKAGGNTASLLFRQMGFMPLPWDMNRNDFFQNVREDQWWAGYRAPPPRTSYFLTGHMRLDNPIFKRLWIPHVVCTLLRDPVDRMLSNYNFTLRRPHNPWHDDVVNKGMSFLEYVANMDAAIGPQYGFFDDTGTGVFARTGSASVEHCLKNLIEKVGILGLTSRFDEFAALSGVLLGRQRILAVPPINVTEQIPDINGMPLKKSLTRDESDEIGMMLKDDIWFYDQARKEYDRRMADPGLKAILAEALPIIEICREEMTRLSALRDPRDHSRRAFERP